MTTLTYDLIVDAGNGYTKAALVKGKRIVATCRFPSLLRFTPDSVFVWGGFTKDGISCVAGKDNIGRRDAIVVGNDNQGKVKYIGELVAGAISGMIDHLPVGSHIRIHLLTLSLNRMSELKTALDKLTTLSIDNNLCHFSVSLAPLLAEGAGCSSYAALAFKNATDFRVLDIGSGTMNLSSYTKARSRFPKRVDFSFAGVGISLLTELFVDALKLQTTNGRVDNRLVTRALESNTYRILDTYEGTCVRKEFDTAVELWLNLPEVEYMIKETIDYLQNGGHVSVCGGGWKLIAVRDAIETKILANVSEEAATRWLVPDDCDVLSAVGAAKVIANDNRKQQAKEDEANGKPKPQRKQRNQQPSDQQQQKTEPGADSLEPIPAVEGNSTSKQPTIAGVSKPSVTPVATSAEDRPSDQQQLKGADGSNLEPSVGG